MNGPASRAAVVLIALACAPAFAPAQSLARRVQDAGAGSVYFTFAAQPDLCGDGENIARVRNDTAEHVDYVRRRGDVRGIMRTGDREPELVKNALFWLGQSRDPRALDLFREILTRR